ncbi:hypothetical protein [Anaplasma marginale]|uniref:hypothetical protein n=1 Tax=Anaplasma marginale TaxID=770 RepID=UPI001D03B289
MDMLENSSAAEVAQRIYDGLSHEVFATDADLVLFKEELAELWSGGNGAASAFCGVPSSEEPRGMHFYGRYVEAQDKQWVERNYDGLENADDWDFAPSAKFVIPGGGVRVGNKEEVEVNFSHAGDIMRATETYNGLAPSLLYDEGKLCVYKSAEGHVYAPAVATSGGKEKPRILLPGPVALVGDAGVLLYE